MFNSISNNFGAGIIQFKDVRESNYIILNATFTYRTDNPAYQAADVLEITVPDLNIDRSTIAGVVMRFIDRRTSYSTLIVSDGGTILKSWIKDKNTLCIEKLTDFDDHEEMIIYIQTIYLQLNQGGNAKKGIKKSLNPKQPETYLYWGSSNFCVIYPKFVFIHIDFSSSKYAYRDSDWRCTFTGLPVDVKGDIPIMGAACNYNQKCGGVNISHVEDGVWTMAHADRNFGFENTGNYVFGMAYLIRDNEVEPDAPGRLHFEEAKMAAQSSSMYFGVMDFELMPNPAMMALSGQTYWSSGKYGTFYPANVPEGVPSYRSFVMARSLRGSGMCIQLCSMYLNTSLAKKTLRFDVLAGGTLLSMNLMETTAIMAFE